MLQDVLQTLSRHDDGQVVDLMGLLLLEAAPLILRLGVSEAQGFFMSRFGERVGFDASTPPGEVRRKVRAYFEARPLPGSLLSVRSALLAAAIESGEFEGGEVGVKGEAALVRFLGGVVRRSVGGSGAPPEGGCKSGPMARFCLQGAGR